MEKQFVADRQAGRVPAGAPLCVQTLHRAALTNRPKTAACLCVCTPRSLCFQVPVFRWGLRPSGPGKSGRRMESCLGLAKRLGMIFTGAPPQPAENPACAFHGSSESGSGRLICNTQAWDDEHCSTQLAVEDGNCMMAGDLRTRSKQLNCTCPQRVPCAVK